jgi:hypothetical protein
MRLLQPEKYFVYLTQRYTPRLHNNLQLFNGSAGNIAELHALCIISIYIGSTHAI